VYDTAGDLTRWGDYYHAFDPLDKKVKYHSTVAPSFTLIDDHSADGERTVIRNVVGTTATYTFSIRDLGGKVLRDVEYNGTSWSWKRDYIYRDGLLLASHARNEGYRHYHLDHLGSPRLVTERTGERLALFRYWPYGQEVVSGNQDTSERMRFTGHERDMGALTSTADDLDCMHARHHGPILARFTSLDLVRGSARRPQSWNLYTYANNNPVASVDLFGLAAKVTPIPSPKPTDGSDQVPEPPAPKPAPLPTPTPREPAEPEPLDPVIQTPAGIGFGTFLALTADAGTLPEGTSAQVDAGLGYFLSSEGVVTPFGFVSGGAYASDGQASSVAAPAQEVGGSPVNPRTLGLFGSAGGGVFFTNASSPQQYAGPFDTRSWNVGILWAQASVQYQRAGSIWAVAISPPLAGAGLGYSYSRYVTTSVVWAPRR